MGALIVSDDLLGLTLLLAMSFTTMGVGTAARQTAAAPGADRLLLETGDLLLLETGDALLLE